MLLEARVAALEAKFTFLLGVLQGTVDLKGRPLPPPPKVNPRDPESVRELRKRIALATAHAGKPVGTGRGAVRTEKQHQAFLRTARRLEVELEELELQLQERESRADAPKKAKRGSSGT